MPQMSPLMWLALMMMVILVYGLFKVANYLIFRSFSVGSSEESSKVGYKSWSW